MLPPARSRFASPPSLLEGRLGRSYPACVVASAVQAYPPPCLVVALATNARYHHCSYMSCPVLLSTATALRRRLRVGRRRERQVISGLARAWTDCLRAQSWRAEGEGTCHNGCEDDDEGEEREEGPFRQDAPPKNKITPLGRGPPWPCAKRLQHAADFLILCVGTRT